MLDSFGLTRTLRTEDSTEANERHKRESETMMGESRCESVRASNEGAAKEELRDCCVAGEIKDLVLIFSLLRFLFFFYCVFFSWVFFIVLFSS